MKGQKPVIDKDLCVGCNLCVDTCEPKCLELVESKVVLKDSDKCDGCEKCKECCPVEAIRMGYAPSSEIKVIYSGKDEVIMIEDNKIIKENAFKLKSFDDYRFNPKAIYQSDQLKVILAYFKKGQFIPVHTPGIDVVLCILEGEAEVVAGDEKMIAQKHDLIIVPKGIKRGIRALSELTVLHIVQPPPTEEDHHEVHTKIAQDRFE